MNVLAKRRLRYPERVREYKKLRGFYAPQREHIKQPMPPRTGKAKA